MNLSKDQPEDGGLSDFLRFGLSFWLVFQAPSVGCNAVAGACPACDWPSALSAGTPPW